MNVEILTALDVDNGAKGNKCPDNLGEPSDLEEASSVTSNDPIPYKAYFWTTQGSAFYYVHITSSSGNSDAKFEMTLSDINVARLTSYDAETTSRKSYLRTKAYNR